MKIRVESTAGRLSCFVCKAVLVLSVGSGCAATYPKSTYTTLGVADPENDERVERDFKKNVANTSLRKGDVIVLIDSLPKGFNYSDGVLSVEEGFSHKILGKFEAKPRGLNMHMMLADFSAYEDGWRKGLCYPQVPLQWITLGLWSVVPTDYACHPEMRRKKASWVGDARAMGATVDGDAVLMTYTYDESSRAFSALGFVVTLDSRVRGPNGDLETTPSPLSAEDN